MPKTKQHFSDHGTSPRKRVPIEMWHVEVPHVEEVPAHVQHAQHTAAQAIDAALEAGAALVAAEQAGLVNAEMQENAVRDDAVDAAHHAFEQAEAAAHAADHAQ